VDALIMKEKAVFVFGADGSRDVPQPIARNVANVAHTEFQKSGTSTLV